MEQLEPPLPNLTSRVSEHTDITYGDLALIGAGLLTNVSSVVVHGWASPGSTLEYTKGTTDPHTLIVRDFVAWTSHRKQLAPGCEERLRGYVDQSGWTVHLLRQMESMLKRPPGTG